MGLRYTPGEGPSGVCEKRDYLAAKIRVRRVAEPNRWSMKDLFNERTGEHVKRLRSNLGVEPSHAQKLALANLLNFESQDADGRIAARAGGKRSLPQELGEPRTEFLPTATSMRSGFFVRQQIADGNQCAGPVGKVSGRAQVDRQGCRGELGRRYLARSRPEASGDDVHSPQ